LMIFVSSFWDIYDDIIQPTGEWSDLLLLHYTLKQVSVSANKLKNRNSRS